SIERRRRPDEAACDGKGAAIASGGDHEFDLASAVDLQDRCQSLVEGHEKGGNLLRHITFVKARAAVGQPHGEGAGARQKGLPERLAKGRPRCSVHSLPQLVIAISRSVISFSATLSNAGHA